MRILITGSEGFIGKHLTRELKAWGHAVHGIDRRHGEDLRRADAAERYIDVYRPDVVVHLAAKVGRLFGEEGVEETAAANAGVTALVAQACAKHGARMVYASTSEIYGDQGDKVCHEDGPLVRPHNLYGLSKRWGEEVSKLYAPEGLTIWRICMPYGPGLPYGKIGYHAAIMNFLHRAGLGEEIPVHRGAERSWCWIGDTVRAMRYTLERSEGGVFNIGRDDDRRPMLEVAAEACRIAGAELSLIKVIDPPARQTVVKRISTEKLRQLGWEPKTEIWEGMKRTYEAMVAAYSG